MSWKLRVMAILFLLTVWAYIEMPDGKVHLIFCDVGQGDGALIVLGPFQALIDTGAYGEKILKCLSDHIPFWDHRLELVFLSHSDNDHDGALKDVRKHYIVDKEIREVKEKDIFRYKDLYFEVLKGSQNNVLFPKSGASETNPMSLVVRVVYGELSALFTGDIDTENELALVSSGVLRQTKVLKVSHHGSKYGSSEEFLNIINPIYSVISVGKKNSYGHPNSDTLMRLDSVKTKVLRTDKQGTVEMVTDGSELNVYTSRE